LSFTLRPAVAADAAIILQCIRGLAAYERLADQAVGTEELIRETLFGERPAAEVVLAFDGEEPAGFALFFQNYSTFLTRPGLYLEDLFVFPRFRGRGLGKRLLAHLARIAVDRRCGRFEWAVLDWNTDAIRVYESVGARPVSDWIIYRLTGEGLTRLAEQGRAAGD
jgi:GNAT superfamily N-acetyltransferase